MMQQLPGKFVSRDEVRIEDVPGRTHHWYCEPQMIPGTQLLVVRGTFPPGSGHPFHHHPQMEEVLYVLRGRAEQWLEAERRFLEPGDAIHISPGVVHATYNAGEDTMEVLAILSPAGAEGPGTVQVEGEPPWNVLR